MSDVMQASDADRKQRNDDRNNKNEGRPLASQSHKTQKCKHGEKRKKLCPTAAACEGCVLLAESLIDSIPEVGNEHTSTMRTPVCPK